jgi:hypothetical protein
MDGDSERDKNQSYMQGFPKKSVIVTPFILHITRFFFYILPDIPIHEEVATAPIIYLFLDFLNQAPFACRR